MTWFKGVTVNSLVLHKVGEGKNEVGGGQDGLKRALNALLRAWTSSVTAVFH